MGELNPTQFELRKKKRFSWRVSSRLWIGMGGLRTFFTTRVSNRSTNSEKYPFELFELHKGAGH